MSPDYYNSYFKTFPVQESPLEPNGVPCLGYIPELFRSFHKATGYELIFVRSGCAFPTVVPLLVIPVEAGLPKMAGRLILWRPENSLPLVEQESAIELARSLAVTIGENYRWCFEMRQREAELASLSLHTFQEGPEQKISLARRLTEILRNGAQAVHCEATALYLLDNETTSLKLRAVWGIPEERFLEPPRSLKGTLADLEALLGNAVILNDPYLQELWKAPENFSTAICIPVTSEVSILGTVWFYSNKYLDTETVDLKIMEIVAGRLAIELENNALLQENRAYRRVQRDLERCRDFALLESHEKTMPGGLFGWAAISDVGERFPSSFWLTGEVGTNRIALIAGKNIPDGKDGEVYRFLQLSRFQTFLKTALLRFSESAPETPFSLLSGLNIKNGSSLATFKSLGTELFFTGILDQECRTLYYESKQCLIFKILPGRHKMPDIVQENAACSDKKRNGSIVIPAGSVLVFVYPTERTVRLSEKSCALLKVVLETKWIPDTIREHLGCDAKRMAQSLKFLLEKNGFDSGFGVAVLKNQVLPL